MAFYPWTLCIQRRLIYYLYLILLDYCNCFQRKSLRHALHLKLYCSLVKCILQSSEGRVQILNSRMAFSHGLSFQAAVCQFVCSEACGSWRLLCQTVLNCSVSQPKIHVCLKSLLYSASNCITSTETEKSIQSLDLIYLEEKGLNQVRTCVRNKIRKMKPNSTDRAWNENS